SASMTARVRRRYSSVYSAVLVRALSCSRASLSFCRANLLPMSLYILPMSFSFGDCWWSGSGAAGAGELLAPPGRGDSHDLDAAAGAGGVDHAALADVEADVADAVEVDEVARHQPPPGHPLADAGELLPGGAGDADPG